MIKFSRCCTPVPGDDIVGFITKGYGVSIHRRDCRNAAGASDPKQAGRWVKVAWSTEDKPFSTTFEIDSTDRSGIWLDIATALSAAKLKVTELSGRDMPTGKARTVATFEVRNVQELETIRTKIRAIDGVIDVRRGQKLMRAVITRVKSASVSIAGSVVGEIGHGLLILLGVGPDDTPELCEKLADKALGLRIFCDEAGKMNRSLADIGGQVLVVSQFTL